MKLDELLRIIRDTEEEFDREMRQGLLQRDLYKAIAAMSGVDACGRIERALQARVGVLNQPLLFPGLAK